MDRFIVQSDFQEMSRVGTFHEAQGIADKFRGPAWVVEHAIDSSADTIVYCNEWVERRRQIALQNVHDYPTPVRMRVDERPTPIRTYVGVAVECRLGAIRVPSDSEPDITLGDEEIEEIDYS
jgi:hypothetical protein